jgi:hypothetical protein
MSDWATKEDVIALRHEIATTKTEIFRWVVTGALFFQPITIFVLFVALDRTVH